MLTEMGASILADIMGPHEGALEGEDSQELWR